MHALQHLPSPVQLLEKISLNGHSIDVLRLDKIHPVISGNKWFKLKYYLDDASAKGYKKLISFGGAYSNHVLAFAGACKEFGFEGKVIIRGEEPKTFSPTLVSAKQLGIELLFVDRLSYRDKTIPPHLDLQQYYIIPEGGYGELGAKGAATMLEDIADNYDHIFCAVGTGTMLAGLMMAAPSATSITGISVLKNNMEITDSISQLILTEKKNWQINHDYHFGGYAKHTHLLIRFMNDLFVSTGIPTDKVYTGKLFFAVNDLTRNNSEFQGKRILVIHSGGLQGNQSLEKGTLIF